MEKNELPADKRTSLPAPATGKLGILTPGLGAVATTFISGVESVRRGLSKPIGSLTQMATIRLGKRTGGPISSHKGFRAAGRPERHRLRRVGPNPRRRVHGGEEGRSARRPRSGADRRFSEIDQANACGFRQRVRHTHSRDERQAGKNKARPRRAVAAGHSRLQVQEQARPAGDCLVCVDGNLHSSRPAARDNRAVREGDGTE